MKLRIRPWRDSGFLFKRILIKSIHRNPHPPWKALRAGVKRRGATKLLSNCQTSKYFGTNFINWGWIGFTTAPATATATATATTTTAGAQRRFGGYDHGNGYDHDCCGSTAIWWLRPRQRLRPRVLRLNDGGHYDVNDGDDCGGSDHIAEPMGILERPSSPPERL